MLRNPIAGALLAFTGLTGVASAQGVGTQIPTRLQLEDFAQTGARSFEDFLGRAVLLEFFAHW